MNTFRKNQRGVSLIEALVAFGVMAFGMLAVVGMQSVLRTNGDLARQRSEAVRIAQDYIEEWRGFSSMTAIANKTAYSEIISTTGIQVDSLSLDPLAAFNTVYTLTRTVSDEPGVTDAISPARKTLLVLVTWTDRNSQAQRVQLSTSIAGLEPALEGSLVAATNPDAVMPTSRRSRSIPPGARDIGGGNSGFIPPGQAPELTSRVAWVFNNTTGDIFLCSTSAASNADLTNTSIDIAACTGRALLVSGFIRFDNSLPPSSNSVVDPVATVADPVPSLGFSVVAPTAPSSPQCFFDTSVVSSLPYFCAVPVTASVPNWSGNIYFTSAQMAVAASTAPDVASLYKACRYSGVPANYTAVTSALVNQNFVLIRAGSASTVFSCPAPVFAFQPA
jgi:Tfp pilus assembly protein PilV